MKKILQYREVNQIYWSTFTLPFEFDGKGTVREKVWPEKGDIFLTPNESITYVVWEDSPHWLSGRKAGELQVYVPVRAMPGGDPDEHYPTYINLERFDGFTFKEPQPSQ